MSDRQSSMPAVTIDGSPPDDRQCSRCEQMVAETEFRASYVQGDGRGRRWCCASCVDAGQVAFNED